jgi:hypothetical protein
MVSSLLHCFTERVQSTEAGNHTFDTFQLKIATYTPSFVLLPKRRQQLHLTFEVQCQLLPVREAKHVGFYRLRVGLEELPWIYFPHVPEGAQSYTPSRVSYRSVSK